MIWALYATLGNNMWTDAKKEDVLSLEEEAWVKFVEKAKSIGINTIFLDVGEGMQWLSHPDISVKGAWSHTKVRREVMRLREMGIALCPKLNFSACHHLWLGPYKRMMSTPIYYTVCRDLIREAYETFLEPEFIHLGMDEEGSRTQINSYSEVVNYRKGDIFWHDYNFLLECVRDTGAAPWVWWDAYQLSPDTFNERVEYRDDIYLNPWVYTALKPEHFTRLDEHWLFKAEVKRFPDQYAGRTYIEDNVSSYIEKWQRAAREGYKICPCSSYVYTLDYNNEDMFYHFKNEFPRENLVGMMTAPWKHTIMENYEAFSKDLTLFSEAKEKYFKGE